MTAVELCKRLGVARRTLFRYRQEYADRAPKNFDNLDEWTAFVAGIKVYDSERTRSKLLQPVDSNSNGKAPAPAADEDPEYTAQAERKQRIIKLKLANEIKQEELKILRRDTYPRKEVLDTIAVMSTTIRAELLELPGEVAEVLLGMQAADIQCHLEEAVRKVLENLSRPELFLKPEKPKE
jgi:hypothetical protein